MDFAGKKNELINAGIKSAGLDDLVHDVMSKQASEINNEGIDAQLTFLFQRGYSVEDIKNY